MTAPPEDRTILHDYLQGARDTMLWKLDGLSEYDARRPMTAAWTGGRQNAAR